MPYAQSILFRLLAFMRKNILLKHTIDVAITVFPCQMSYLSRVARDDTSHHNTYYAAIGQQVVFSLMKQVMSKFT